MRGFAKGDPRARIAGRRGGKASGVTRSMFPKRGGAYGVGYKAGWIAGFRAGKRERAA